MEHLVVKVNEGLLRGVVEKNIYRNKFVAFRGVPYAKPPIGNLRFKDPEPLDPWTGIKDAINFSDRCAQQDWFTHSIIGSDDCLYLNIYTPTLNLSAPRAVMVWIHGGAFVHGSGDDDLYGPDYLIEKDIVLVTINYRVGILGFLNANDEEAPGNQGLKDQVQALIWIQKNITQFSGDPNNVTIFGESAGGASIHYLTFSPMAQGLFHKVIIQSGVATNPWASSIKSPMESMKKLAAVFNKDISNVKEFINYLRTLDVHCLIEAQLKIRTLEDKILFVYPFIPSIDSKAKNPFLLNPLEVASQSGIKIPCMCGYTSHEGIIIAAGMNNSMFEKINSDPENLLIHPLTMQFLLKNNITVNDIKHFYFGNEALSPENMEKIVDAMSAIFFVFGIHNIVEIQSKIQNIPTYFYKFNYDAEISLLKKFLNVNVKGTCHAEELGYIFYSKLMKLLDEKPPVPGSIEYLLIQRFTTLWTNFAKIGNPTPQITEEIPVEWKPIDNSDEYKYLYIADELSMEKEMNITKYVSKKIKNKL